MRSVALSAVLCAVLAPLVLAQAHTGHILVKAVDPDGGLLPGATVTITGAALKNPVVGTTDRRGEYRSPDLPAGTYAVKVEMPSFRMVVRNDVTTTGAEPVRIEVALPLAGFVDELTVTARDVGFVGINALAGGRLGGALAETPVAYSVQTREFLDALNISDLNEALNWTVSATTTPDDGGGQLFGGTGGSTVRGVSSNAVNRNFFVGGANPATYNLERMDYARGPNSILFGTGTISGTSNAVVKSARVGRNATEVKLEGGSYRTYRGTLDANYSRSRLAGRVVGTWQDSQSWRDWEGTARKGVSPSMTAQLTPSTRLSLIGDLYEQKVIAGMNALTDSFSGWDGVTVFTGPQTANPAASVGALRVGTNAWVISPGSGRGYGTALNYANTMQTQGYGGQRPIRGVRPAATASLGYNGVPILDSPFGFTPGIYDAAVEGSFFRIPARSFNNLGPNPTSINRFRDATLFLDHQLGPTVKLQLSGAVNRQYSYGLIDYYTNQGYPNIFIDINRLLPDGTANPSFLQPYNEFIRPERQKLDITNRALRLSAAYAKDLQWVDVKANLIGAVEGQEVFRSREYFMLPIDPDPRAWGLVGTPRAQTLRYRYYWNQTAQRELVEPQQVTLVDPATGTSRTVRPAWVLGSDRNDATNLNNATTKYLQGFVNLGFWKKKLILLGAFRHDTINRSQKVFLRPLDHPEGFGSITRDHFIYRPDAPVDYFRLTYVPKDASGRPTSGTIPQPAPATRPRDAATGVALPQYAGDRFQDDFNPPPTRTRKPTFALGGILNLGRGVSLWANVAQTFNPTDFTKTTIDYDTPPPSVSHGLDYGVRVSFGPKLFASLSRYDSDEKDAAIDQPTGYSNIQNIINVNAIGDTNVDGRNRRGLGDVPVLWKDVFDRRATGYELEVVANPREDWRLTLNFGYTDATQTDTYRQTRAWVDGHADIMKAILADAGVIVGPGNVAAFDPSRPAETLSSDAQAGRDAWNSLQGNRANWVSGTQELNRMTQYTANVYSDYRLSRWLRELRLGYGMQFRGRQVIGYRGADTIVDPASPTRAIDNPSVDAYTPVWQKAYILGTATVGYPLRLSGRKIDFNLSVSNLFDYDKPLYNTTFLRPTDGNLATPARTTYPRAFSYVTPRSVRLVATYVF